MRYFPPRSGHSLDKYGRLRFCFFSCRLALGYLFIGFAFALWMVFAGASSPELRAKSIDQRKPIAVSRRAKPGRKEGGFSARTFGSDHFRSGNRREFKPLRSRSVSLWRLCLSSTRFCFIYSARTSKKFACGTGKRRIGCRLFLISLCASAFRTRRHYFFRVTSFSYNDLRLRAIPSSASATAPSKRLYFASSALGGNFSGRFLNTY